MAVASCSYVYLGYIEFSVQGATHSHPVFTKAELGQTRRTTSDDI